MDKPITELANKIQSLLDAYGIFAQDNYLIDSKQSATNLGYYVTLTVVIRGANIENPVTIPDISLTKYKALCKSREYAYDYYTTSVLDDINKQLLKELQSRNLDPSEWTFELIDFPGITDTLNFKIVRRHNYE